MALVEKPPVNGPSSTSSAVRIATIVSQPSRTKISSEEGRRCEGGMEGWRDVRREGRRGGGGMERGTK